MGAGRRCRIGLTALVVLGLVGAPAVAGAQAAPTLVVEPAVDLVDGQTLAVAGTGLTAEYGAQLVQCAAPAGASPAFDPASCDFDGSGFVEVDAEGAFSTDFTVDASFRTPTEAVVDCRQAVDACVLLAVPDGSDTATPGVAPLRFAADAPLRPPPVVTIDPATDLVDGQEVVVTGSGLLPQRFVLILQCAVGGASIGQCAERGYGQADAEGRLTATVPVGASFTTFDGTRVDCRPVSATCALVVGDGSDPAEAGVAAVRFDPDAPLRPAPVITVEPATDLVDGQLVTVTGTGFRPGAFVSVAQCRGGDEAPTDCRPASFDGSQADETGAVSVTVGVRAVLRLQGGELDCRRGADACSLAVDGSDGFALGDRGVVALGFDPDGPLLPPPTISVEPTTDLADGQVVTVTGAGFAPLGFVAVTQCSEADPASRRCAFVGGGTADPGGGLRVSIAVAATIEDDFGEVLVADDSDGDGEASDDEAGDGDGDEAGDGDGDGPRPALPPVDCRAGPTPCVLAASTDLDAEAVSTGLEFGAPAPSRGRYLDPVFDEVEVTRDIVYGEAVDNTGATVQLRIDLYQPAGDTTEQRPVVVWAHGGGFSSGDKASMAGYAEDSARRGYVGASISYRLNRTGAPGGGGIVDAYEDARVAVAWLRDHAEEHRIDPRAIAFGGYSAGAVTAFNLAHGPDLATGDRSGIAAGISIAGLRSLGVPERGEPPVVVFHGTDDGTVPYTAGVAACDQARAAEVPCDLVTYEGADHGISGTFQRDISDRTATFLAEQVLAPLGYVEPLVPDEAECTVLGTAGPDRLMGTSGDDVVCGLGGDDVVIGHAGDDVLVGGAGDDRLVGRAGSDRLHGGEDHDRLLGGSGRDRLHGGSGDDVLLGGLGDDVLDGGEGDDRLRGGSGDDRLHEP